MKYAFKVSCCNGTRPGEVGDIQRDFIVFADTLLDAVITAQDVLDKLKKKLKTAFSNQFIAESLYLFQVEMFCSVVDDGKSGRLSTEGDDDDWVRHVVEVLRKQATD